MFQSLTGNLGSGQQLFLEQSGNQTVITLAQTTSGQQQSQRSSFLTGAWSETPVLMQTAIGWMVQLKTAQGHFTIEIAGTAIQLLANSTPVAGTRMPLQTQETAASMSPMPPLEPLPPLQMGKLKMGEMEMQMQPMTMRMGNLEMQMGNQAGETPAERAAESDRRAKFCSQCGQAVQPEDQFCSQCGHLLR